MCAVCCLSLGQICASDDIPLLIRSCLIEGTRVNRVLGYIGDCGYLILLACLSQTLSPGSCSACRIILFCSRVSPGRLFALHGRIRAL